MDYYFCRGCFCCWWLWSSMLVTRSFIAHNTVPRSKGFHACMTCIVCVREMPHSTTRMTICDGCTVVRQGCNSERLMLTVKNIHFLFSTMTIGTLQESNQGTKARSLPFSSVRTLLLPFECLLCVLCRAKDSSKRKKTDPSMYGKGTGFLADEIQKGLGLMTRTFRFSCQLWQRSSFFVRIGRTECLFFELEQMPFLCRNGVSFD